MPARARRGSRRGSSRSAGFLRSDPHTPGEPGPFDIRTRGPRPLQVGRSRGEASWVAKHEGRYPMTDQGDQSEEAPDFTGRVIVGVDGSPGSELALRCALDRVERFGPVVPFHSWDYPAWSFAAAILSPDPPICWHVHRASGRPFKPRRLLASVTSGGNRQGPAWPERPERSTRLETVDPG